MEKRDYTTIEGSVDRIVYANDDTGFTVLDLNVQGELTCVVGQLLGVEAGEELQVTGYYQSHPTFGAQFKAEMFERRLPATSAAIEKYLGSGVVKGIGPALARRIVEKFGDQTFQIIENSPERLTEVSGLSRAKTERLAEDFRQVFGVRALMVFLQQHGIGAMQSVLIYKKWGASALERIQMDPYQLCTDELNVSFAEADAIAKRLGFPPEDPRRIYAGLRFVLSHNCGNGHTCLPRKNLLPAACTLLGLEDGQLVTNVLEEALDERQFCAMTTGTELIFLPEYYDAQRYIASRLQLMLMTAPGPALDAEQSITLIEQEKGIRYEALQRKAILQAVENDCFILTGGPGTGKTTTLNGIIELLEQQGKRVALAAPTGRAAKRMSEVTDRDAKTIHRLLEVSPGFAKSNQIEFNHREDNPIDADAIIIDEMSMVDTLLFAALLRGIKPGAKLILVGDSDQLPSVGAGNILRDLLESDTIPTVELRHIFRQAAQSLIVTNAHAIVQGEMPDLSKKDNDCFFLPQTDPVHAAQLVSDLCCERLPNAYHYSPFDQIQVLCPSRKGELGVQELNNRLQSRLNPAAEGKIEWKSGTVTYRTGDKVMQIRNNYDIPWSRETPVGIEKSAGIFNGDIGIIKMIDRGSRTLEIDFDGRLAYYDFDMLNELELAYAVTVHKSQGSEFDAVILPLMDGYDKLYYRNLLYTAVTRAKKILIIVGQQKRVEFMVRNNRRTLRYTGLKQMLQEAVLG